jgi:hypothetical protein
MRKSMLLLVFAIIFFVIGCTSPSKVVSSWIGKTKDELYQKWGQPMILTKVKNGEEILIYSATMNSGQAILQPYLSGNGNINYFTHQNNSPGKSRTYLFCINSKGIISSGVWQDL